MVASACVLHLPTIKVLVFHTRPGVEVQGLESMWYIGVQYSELSPRFKVPMKR